MKTNLTNSYLAVLLVVVLFSACVKDTDFDQAEDIAVTPIVELDLIHFDLPAMRFFDTVASSPVLTVRDTTDLEFLNDEEISANLERVEFSSNLPMEFSVLFK